MRAVAVILVVVCLAAIGSAELTELDDVESRFLFLQNTSQLSVSVNPASVLLALAAGAVGLLGLMLLYFLLSGGEESYSGYSSGSSYSGGDSGYSRSAANTWSTLSAVDWIALAEELYESADELGSQPCQQRLACQLAAGADSSGSGAARAAGSALDWLSYLQLLPLPADVQQTLQQVGDAARSGRSAPADCELHYPACPLSVTKLMDKYASTS